MTNQQAHRDNYGMDLIVRRHYSKSDQMVITTGLHADDQSKRYSTIVPTARLLAMIDTIDPDAMRAYLRETVEHAYLENMGVPVTEPEIPEADSPEDVDERPDRDDLTERAQIDRSWALDRATDALGRLSAVGSPAGALPLLDVAGWIIDGTINLPEQILDTNMAGEVIS